MLIIKTKVLIILLNNVDTKTKVLIILLNNVNTKTKQFSLFY